MPCLECGAKLSRSKRGGPRRFCSTECKLAFNNIATKRGVHVYHLFCAIRRDRAKAKELNLWTELCRLELAFRDEDAKAGRTMPSHKPAEMTLADIAELERLTPSTNLYEKEANV